MQDVLCMQVRHAGCDVASNCEDGPQVWLSLGGIPERSVTYELRQAASVTVLHDDVQLPIMEPT
jgi:hypothetical protein